MKNWFTTPDGNLINLDHIAQIRAYNMEGKWYVIGDIAGKEMGYLLSEVFESEQQAKDKLQSLSVSLT